MKPSELLRSCADCIDRSEEFKIEPALSLAWPKGSGRFPMHGELLCVNASEERVYRVRVADALTYLSRTLKAAHPARPQEKTANERSP